MSSFIPQCDPNLAQRSRALRAAQQDYQFNYTHVSPLAIVERVPLRDEFSRQWMEQVAKRFLTVLSNRAALEVSSLLRGHHQMKITMLNALLRRGETAIRDVRTIVGEALRFEGRIGARAVPASSLADYAKLFRTIGLPPVANGYQNDRAFAWMRLAGPNPVVLQQWTQQDDRLSLSDAHLRTTVPTDSLDAAFAEGRMYLADYSLLDGAQWNDFPNGQKYLYAPLAAFVVEQTSKTLLPVAIQCKQTPARDNPIFTPDDGFNWLIAKTIVEIADANLHEAHTHLGRTHLFVEPFVVTTFRQLAPTHPLARLLVPHFEGTLAINAAAWQKLIATKGPIDALFGGAVETSRAVAVTGVQTASVMDMLLPDTLRQRGVQDSDALPDYPYRDDAMLYWNAIVQWVQSYLNIYYNTDLDVQQDHELQGWARELGAANGGRLRGLPNGGQLRTFAELTDIISLVIYTSSVQHAAVNFPQYDIMSYVPGMPLASYAPAPASKAPASQADYLAMLPPMDMAELQMELGYLLGSVHYTQLGQYARKQFGDPRISASLTRFQQQVASIGNTIATRNQKRFRPYQTLAPAGIPQSINI